MAKRDYYIDEEYERFKDCYDQDGAWKDRIWNFNRDGKEEIIPIIDDDTFTERFKECIVDKSKSIKRSLKFFIQRRLRGWDDSDTWDLSGVISRHALPRIKRFRELTMTCPVDIEEDTWDRILETIQWYFEIMSGEDLADKLQHLQHLNFVADNEELSKYLNLDEKELKHLKKVRKYFENRITRGHRYLGQYFNDLWW